MFNLIRADLYKLRRTMAIKIIFGITTICAIAMSVIAYLIQQGKVDASMTGIGFLFCDVNVMSILGAVVASIYICGDFDNKTIHEAIASGCSRSAVIIAKTVVFCCTLAFILLPYAIVTGIALGTGKEFGMSSVAMGFLNLLASEAGATFTVLSILKLLAVMLALIIVYMAQLSVCVPLALLLRKPVLVVAIYYGFSILCGQLGQLAAKYRLLDRIFACTPYGGKYSFLTIDAEAEQICNATNVSVIFIIVMLAITYYEFRKTEIR